MEYLDLLTSAVRWFHIAAGLLFVGLNWWFGLVFIPFNLSADMETRKKALTDLIPRALFWFRWAAMYNLLLGVALLIIVFYAGGQMIEGQQPWTVGSYVMVAVAMLIYRLYDLAAKSPLAKDNRLFAAVGLIVVALIVYGMIEYGHFSYRAYVIHVGVMFGGIMVGNVWEKVWPTQRKLIEGLKAGTPPDPAAMGLVLQRSRHNTYLSVPLLWCMIEAHTAVPAANHWLYMIAMIALGWAVVFLAYKKQVS